MYSLKKYLIGYLFFLFCINQAYSQNQRVELPGTEILKFQSKIDTQQ